MADRATYGIRNRLDGYDITSVAPTGEQFIELRRLAGLTPPPVTASIAEAALARSVHILVVRPRSQDPQGAASTEPVGMIRLIGDGHVFVHVTDMCVLPEHRGKGIASKLLDDALAWIDENARGAYVSMIADPPAQSMYKKKGFQFPTGSAMARSSWGKLDGAA